MKAKINPSSTWGWAGARGVAPLTLHIASERCGGRALAAIANVLHKARDVDRRLAAGLVRKNPENHVSDTRLASVTVKGPDRRGARDRRSRATCEPLAATHALMK